MSDLPSIFENPNPDIAPDVDMAVYIGVHNGQPHARVVTNPYTYDKMSSRDKAVTVANLVAALQQWSQEATGLRVEKQPAGDLEGWVQT